MAIKTDKDIIEKIEADVKEVCNKLQEITEKLILIKKDTENLIDWKKLHEIKHNEVKKFKLDFSVGVVIAILASFFAFVSSFLIEYIKR